MITDVEHLFICLLVICTTSLGEYLFRSFAHFLKISWIWNRETILDFQVAQCNPVLISGRRQNRENQGNESMREMTRRHCFWRWRRASWVKGCECPLVVGKADHPLEHPTGRWACQHLDFSPVRPILEFWPTELCVVLSHCIWGNLLLQ